MGGGIIESMTSVERRSSKTGQMVDHYCHLEDTDYRARDKNIHTTQYSLILGYLLIFGVFPHLIDSFKPLIG